MQEAFIRSQKLKYNEEAYNQWSQLPPNIPLPNTPSISAFELTFTKLIYLNQITTDQQSLELKLEWWGMKNPHRLIYDQISICKGKYVICSPIERLLSYLNDMKLMGIQICNKYRGIGKSYLNFMVLKGWRGQFYEGVLDIKQGNKKIGELSYEMEVIMTDHPYMTKASIVMAEQSQAGPTQRKKQIEIKIKQPSGQQIIKRSSIEDNEDIIYRQNQQNPQISNHKIQSNKRVTMKSILKSQIAQEYTHKSANDIYFASKNKIDKVLYQQPIYREINHGKYEAELIRLVQDYNILFGVGNTTFSPKANLQNNIEIQIVKIDIKQKPSTHIQVIVPLIDGNTNYYRLAVGGLVKLQFASTISENQLLKYLRQSVISFKQGDKIQGTIKLSKILSNCNQIIEITLMQKDKEGKREIKKQRGTCCIKAIPPVANKQPSIISPPKPQKIENQTKRQQLQIRQEEYVLLNFKTYNSIQRYNRNYNLFVRIINVQDTVGQTNTLWNKSSSFIFEDKVTCKVMSNRLKFELYDRQKNLIKLASGELTMNSPLGINIEIPLKAKYINSQTIIGYISLDYFKNGLQSITKMVGVLNQKQQVSQPLHQNNYLTHEKQNVIDQPPKNEEEIKIINNIEENKENQTQINIVQQQKPIQKELQTKKKIINNEPRLNIMQIYNKIFTYMYSNPQIITILTERDEHKVTQFLSIFNEVINRSIMSIGNLNELITHLLFRSTHNRAESINKIDTLSFRESYEAFRTYYEEIVEERDSMLAKFLSILEQMGLSINDLEYELTNNKNIWEKLNELLAYHKGKCINIVQDIKQHYSKKDNKYGINEISGSQFCDVLRKYQVYQVTLGSEVNQILLCEKIYRNTVELLEELSPNIELYSYNQLIGFLEDEQIILSSWQLLNLREYLTKYGNKKTIPLYPNLKNQFENNSGRFRQIDHHQIAYNKQNGAQSFRPTISKSPTFGHLHQPQHMKQELLTSQNYMVDSLALKMHNLAISPINYNSNQTNYHQTKAKFSNLKYRLFDLYINDIRVGFGSVDNQTVNNYRSNSINEEPYSKQIGSSIQPQQRGESAFSQKCESKSIPQKQSSKSGTLQDNANIQLNLYIQRAFSYKLQIHFQQMEEGVELECLHDEWNAIVSEQGEYLGGVMIC